MEIKWKFASEYFCRKIPHVILKEFFTVGSCLLFSLIILKEIELCNAQSNVIVNIEVDGLDVVKTGIRQYSFAESHYVTITCSSPIFHPANIFLLNSEGQPIPSNVASRNGITEVTGTLEQPEGKYYCLLNISVWSSSNSYCELVMSSEVDLIRFNPVLPLYASSVGRSGYVGERAFFKFTKDGNNFRYCSFEVSSENVRDILIDDNVPEETCICYYCGSPCYYYCYNSNPYCQNYAHCSLLRLSVYPSLKLNIFAENVTLDSSVMEFSCNSTPPRLMYWKVFGSHGNLFDFDNINLTISVNTRVNIKQSPGRTTLRIWETVPGGNGIHTVMCSTYDTEKRVVAFVRITTLSKSSSDCASSDTKDTNMQETTSNNPSITTTTIATTATITDKRSTFVVTKTEKAEYYDDVEVQASTEQGFEMRTDTLNDYMLIGFVSLPYLIIIVLLFGIICYMHYRNRSLKIELSTAVKVEHTSPEAVLHDNPAYLSFSEVNGCSPDNENDEKTYANL